MSAVTVTETWRSIPGYEGYYSVSDLGRVRREMPAMRTRPGFILTLYTKRNGYQTVNLTRDTCTKNHLVHRLVLAAFAGPSALECNHRNGVKGDNRLSNLEYVTHAENVRHAVEVLGKPIALHGASNPGARYTTEQVREIVRRRIAGESFAALRRDFGISRTHVSNLVSGKWRKTG